MSSIDPETTNLRAAPASHTKTKVRAVDAGVPDTLWRRVHPLSPVLNTWQVLAAIIAFLTYQNADVVIDIANSDWGRAQDIITVVGYIGGGITLVVILAAVYSWLAWRATKWAVTDTAVWFREGILFRSQKHARLERIQAVDIVHPLLGRMVGLGKLNVEVAGGGESNFTFGFLRTRELNEARAEILALAAGIRLAERAAQTDHASPSPPVSAPTSPMSASTPESAALPVTVAGNPHTPVSITQVARLRHEDGAIPVAPERLLYTVSPSRLIGSLIRDMVIVIMALVAIVMMVGAVILTIKWGFGGLNALWGLVGGVLAMVSYMWGRFAGEFNFRAAVSTDGIRIHRGLTETRAQTIPPRRIHAVRIHQPLLWRGKGWYRVTINQAGYGLGGDDSAQSQASSVLLPVGTRAEAELALWLVVRDLGVNNPRALLDAAFHGKGDGEGFISVPRSARRIDPLAWKRRAVAVTDTVVVIRDGWMVRNVIVVPVERIQSMSISQGPLQRMLGLVTVGVHAVAGTIMPVIHHVSEQHAAHLTERLLGLSRIRRASEPPEKWMQRVHARVNAGAADLPAPVEDDAS
ncbi:PH domain-containing protein [Schaalia suimastitidis]|uniref:PH domain-containing protein n=1 Tax=Schaalia suimastitidis TaxID=121163 RepID=UPI0004191C59|nr:PH domain-containing protein [Schaalia suimastitidis]